jgi:hypothetical protein
LMKGFTNYKTFERRGSVSRKIGLFCFIQGAGVK